MVNRRPGTSCLSANKKPRNRGASRGHFRRVIVLLRFDHTDVLAILRAFLFELDLPGFLREQGVIAAGANIGTRMHASAALANNDVAGNCFLATV